MASDPTHALEVYGQVFVEGTEGGRRSQQVPFEIYSDYSSTNFGSRNNMKLSTQASDVFMGFENYNGDNFFIQRENVPSITFDTDKNIVFSDVEFGESNVTTQIMNSQNWYPDYTYLNAKKISLGSNGVDDNEDDIYARTYIIDNNDDLFACGRSTGDGFGIDRTISPTFVPIKILNNISDVSSSYHTVIIKSDGSVWGTGYNTSGQLGLGFYSDPIKTFTQESTSMTDASRVFSLFNRTIVLKNDGSVWGTGKNDYGQLGLGAGTTSVSVFTSITNDVKDVSGGLGHTIILKNDGSVWGTGRNGSGQLGLGSLTTSVSVFTSITDDVKEISAGSLHTLILKNDGSVWGTGRNSNGQLGIGSTVDKNTFTAAVGAGTSDVTQISAGSDYTLILKNDWSVHGTGRNYNGVFGNGTTNDTNVFTNTYNYCDYKIITNSEDNSNSILQQSDGKVYGTGRVVSGELGMPRKIFIIPFPATGTDLLINRFTRAFATFNNNTIGGGNNLYINSRFSSNFPGSFKIKNTSSPQKTQIGIQLIASNSNSKIFNQHNIKLSDVNILIGSEAYEMSVNKHGTVTSVGGFASFTGAHVGNIDEHIEPGFIVSIDPLINPQIISINNVIPTLKISSINNDPNVYGVSSDGKTFNALGEGAIWVSDVNGPLSLGDYITSSTLSGYGKRQDDIYMTNYTVGKILQNCDFNGDNVRYLSVSSDNSITTVTKDDYLANTGSVYRASFVGCTYHCG